MSQPLRAVPTISAEERARRQKALDYARRSVRLEGFTMSTAAEGFAQQFIDGEISHDEMSAAIRKLHGG